MSGSYKGRSPFLVTAALPVVVVAATLLQFSTGGRGGAGLHDVAGGLTEQDAAAPAASGRARVSSSAWERAVARLPGTLVAVVDTGVAVTPDLAGQVDAGQSFVGGAATVDENGHGTAVAGILAGLTGVCHTCRILPLRVSAGAGGTASSENIAAAVDTAVQRGAAVVNLSMVAANPSEIERAAFARAVAAGVVVVAAAGNAASSTESYPAAYPGVLSVGAAGDDGAIAGFSNRGPWVSVLAPGCGRSHAPGGGEVLFCGTSAAAPYVAGVVAVLRAAVPSATESDVIGAIRRSSHPVQGAADGIVDPAAALAAIGGAESISQVAASVKLVTPAATKRKRVSRAKATKATRAATAISARSASVVRSLR
jgi:subtilisin family serine protease